MKDGVTKAAYYADGRSRRCTLCPLQPCTDTELQVCTRAFVEGFRKGANWRKNQPYSPSNSEIPNN